MPNTDAITWDYDSPAFGVVHTRLQGRKASVGGFSVTPSGTVRGYVLGEKVYEGKDIEQAQKAIIDKIQSFPECVIRGLQD